MLKSFSCLLLSILGIGFLLVNSANFCIVEASTDVNEIPKPSIPEFTVKLVDNSYDVTTTYSIDPFTGENIIHYGTMWKTELLKSPLKTNNLHRPT